MLEISVHYVKIDFDWEENGISLNNAFIIESGRQSAKGINFEDAAFKCCDFSETSEAINDMKSTCFLKETQKGDNSVNIAGIIAYYNEYDTERGELTKALYCGFDSDGTFKELWRL